MKDPTARYWLIVVALLIGVTASWSAWQVRRLDRRHDEQFEVNNWIIDNRQDIELLRRRITVLERKL